MELDRRVDIGGVGNGHVVCLACRGAVRITEDPGDGREIQCPHCRRWLWVKVVLRVAPGFYRMAQRLILKHGDPVQSLEPPLQQAGSSD